jgi:hypothetical protein
MVEGCQEEQAFPVTIRRLNGEKVSEKHGLKSCEKVNYFGLLNMSKYTTHFDPVSGTLVYHKRREFFITS